MTAHYIKTALRNIAKHKTQTIISIVSIGVSVTIFSIVSSWMLRINGDSLLGPRRAGVFEGEPCSARD